jgi:hypothetical protein
MKTHPTSPHEDNGLTVKVDGYYARYYSEGKQLFKKLHTSEIQKARAERDNFYSTLTPRVHRKNGRHRVTPPGLDAKALPEGVTYRKPWHLSIDGKSLGYFHTMKEVEAAYARVNDKDLARRPLDSE